ncbi:hypothetical protein Ancab_032555 [Ancistrocladus abbreviatus]
MELLNISIQLLIVLVFTHYFLAFLKRSKFSPQRLPPGPIPLPIMGNIFQVGSKPHKALAELAKTYGPIMTIELGCLTTVVISSVPMAKLVLQKYDGLFSDRTPTSALSVLNHNESSVAMLPPNPHWRRLRKICNTHIFAVSRLDASSGLRRKKVQQLLSYVDDCCKAGTAVNIGQVGFTTSLNFLSNTFFSLDLADPGSDTESEFRGLISSILEVGGAPNCADFFPILKMFDPQGFSRRNEITVRKMFGIFDELIDKRMQSRKENGFAEDNDVLDAFLDMFQESGNELQRSDLLHLLLDLFIAGTDTTSSTLEWVMTELLRNPKQLRKAREELKEVIGKGNSVEEEDFIQLPYLQAIIKETFRLHPVVPLLLPRRVVSTNELCGFTIPKKAQVFVNIWAMGKEESLWKDANLFMPERFLGSNIDVKGHDFELIPFGAGRRICPGLPLAYRMLPCMLGSLLHSFDWKLEEGVTEENIDMDDKFGITLAKAKSLYAIPIRDISGVHLSL